MDISAIFFTLAVLILVGMYLYAPFTQKRARRVVEEDHDLSALMAERDRVLSSLQELDFDFKLGKIPDEDYPTQRANLLQKGADILRKLDEMADLTPNPSPVRRGESEETRIEKAVAPLVTRKASKETSGVAARRADGSNAKPKLSDEDIESMITTRRKGRKGKSAGFCPKCGKPVMMTDRFCPSCGKALQ